MKLIINKKLVLSITFAIAVTFVSGHFYNSAEASYLVSGRTGGLNMYNLDGSGGTNLFYNPYGSVSGVSIDSLNNDIYFTPVQGYYKSLGRYDLDTSSTNYVYMNWWDNNYYQGYMDVDPISHQAYINLDQPMTRTDSDTFINQRDLDTGGSSTFYSADSKVYSHTKCNYYGYNCSTYYNYPHDVQDIQVDPMGRNVYWADSREGTINRMSMDTTDPGNPEVLYSGLVKPRGIALDVGAGLLFWTEEGDADNDSVIGLGNISGSTAATDIYTSTDTLYDIVADPSTQKIYWSEYGDEISFADYNGSNAEAFTTPGGSQIYGNAIDISFDSGVAPENPLSPGSTDPDGGLNFNDILFKTGQMVFFNPATGLAYDYTASGQNFESVLLPDIGDEVFELYLWNGSAYVLAESDLPAGSAYNFGIGGVDRFRIIRIEEEPGAPGDLLSFMTGLTFEGEGVVDVTMTPVSVVPEPISSVLFVSGAVTLGVRRFRRKS